MVRAGGAGRIRWGAALVLLGALSACSSPAATSSPPARSKAVSPGSSVPLDLARNARADVSAASCAMTGGHWVFDGTVHNATDRSASFQIVVDFVSQPGSTVLSTSVVDVPDVAAHATKAWSATGAAGRTAVACLVRQAQTT